MFNTNTGEVSSHLVTSTMENSFNVSLFLEKLRNRKENNNYPEREGEGKCDKESVISLSLRREREMGERGGQRR